MASKRYPDPHKQVDAGYFWLTIGLSISLLIVIFRPFGIYQFTTGLVLYGLYHLIAGKFAVRALAQNESESEDWWMSEPVDQMENFDHTEDELITDDFGYLEEIEDEETFDTSNSDQFYESENDYGDEDIFSKSWRNPVYDQNEDDDIEDPPDLIVYRSDYQEWSNSDEDDDD